MTNQFAAVSILVLTLTLALRRPTFLRVRLDHAPAAMLGAALIVGLNIVPIPLAIRQLQQLIFPFITIVSLMVITSITERTGLFDSLAYHISRKAGGRPKVLFTYLYFTGAAVGSLFTNDAAVLILTPLVFQLIEQIKEPNWNVENQLPFYFAVLYVANVVAVLVISNPIDIIVCDMFGITFLEYAIWNALPSLVSIFVSYLGLRIAFRKSFATSYRPLERKPEGPRHRDQWICGVLLVGTLAAFFMQSLLGVSTWLVALIAAVVLMGFHTFLFRSSPLPIIKSVGWDVLIFVAGMFIIATGVRNIGMTEQIAHVLQDFGQRDIGALTQLSGHVACLVSAIMNNHPTAMTMALAVKDMNLPMQETHWVAFAALMGGDLGPKMLPTGSLAAMLWFRILRSRGMEVSYRTYVKIGVPVTLAALFLAILTLNVEILISDWLFS